MISETIRVPGSYSEIVKGAGGGLPSKQQKMLIIAPRLPDGKIDALLPTEVYSAQQAAECWGAGSIMHRMAAAAFRQFGAISLTGCAVDDSDNGIAANATITLTGTASATGALTLWIGTDRIPLRIDRGETAVSAALRLTNDINIKYPNLPITATVSGGVITLTAKNKGTCGNSLGQKGHPSILSETNGIDVTTTAYTGGTGDPDLAEALSKVAGERYHIIVIPFTSLDAGRMLSEHLTEVSNESNQLGGRGFMFLDGDFADVATFGEAINNERMCVGYIKGVKRFPFENAAAFAAMQAAEPAPWLATNDKELIGCDAPTVDDRFIQNEVNNLLWKGITPFCVGAGDRVRCVRAISTYVKTDTGVEDDTFLDSFKIATADYVREAIRVRHSSDFQNKILRDNHVAGEPPNVVTPADIRSTNLDVCRRIEREGGLNNVNFFAEKFTSVRNPNVPGRVDSVIPIDIVDAAHIMANTIMISSTL